MIRAFSDGDAAAIVGFWNPIVRDTGVTFTSALKTPAEMVAYVAARRAAGREVFVAEVAGQVAGFAGYDQFRPSDGYLHSMEHTVILGPAARGQGLGRALMRAVEDHARAAGAHVMIAAISGENPAAVAFHAAIGYAEAGRLPQVGRKLGRWMDLVLMQKLL